MPVRVQPVPRAAANAPEFQSFLGRASLLMERALNADFDVILDLSHGWAPASHPQTPLLTLNPPLPVTPSGFLDSVLWLPLGC